MIKNVNVEFVKLKRKNHLTRICSMENEFINEGTFQEYDYNNETKECEWKQIHEQSNKKLKERLEVIETDYHVWGG
jgi:hypothetical protein